MLQVNEGDYILAPHIPRYGTITVLVATEDWKTGYSFTLDHGHHREDFGHVFPVKRIATFSKNADVVDKRLQQSFRSSGRFWNLNKYDDAIENILASPEHKRSTTSDHQTRFDTVLQAAFTEAFDSEKFRISLEESLHSSYAAASWEFALEYGIQKAFPQYVVRKVGGANEQKHGADLLIEMPSPLQTRPYGVAIQIKDYTGEVDESVLAQIEKSRNYWEQEEDINIIDLVVIFTKAKKSENEGKFTDTDVSIIYGDDLQDILVRIAGKMINEFEVSE